MVERYDDTENGKFCYDEHIALVVLCYLNASRCNNLSIITYMYSDLELDFCI